MGIATKNIHTSNILLYKKLNFYTGGHNKVYVNHPSPLIVLGGLITIAAIKIILMYRELSTKTQQ